MGSLWQEVRLAARRLAGGPGFAAVAVLTLAVAIGANTAVFSLVRGVLLRPLPFAEADRLALLWTDLPEIGLHRAWLSEPEILDLRAGATLLEQVAVARGSAGTVAEGNPERIQIGLISTNLFPMLGVAPVLGRSFAPDDEAPGAPRKVILAHSFWQRRFGGDPGVLGDVLRIDGEAAEILGVMQPGFRLELPARARFDPAPDVWAPYQVDYREQDRHSHNLAAMAKLREGATTRQAAAQVEALAGRLAPVHYSDTGFGLRIEPWHDALTGPVRPALTALFAAVGFVLMIACANVANLALARATGRGREIAVRLALGAGRLRIIRQLMVESLLLSGAGGLAGVALATWALDSLSWMGGDLPQLAAVRIDAGVLSYSLLLCVLTGAAFGLAPALRASRSAEGLSPVLGCGNRAIEAPRDRLRAAAVVAQIALSLMLVVGAGLMIRTLVALQRVRPGFVPAHALSLRVSLPPDSYPREALWPFFQELENRIGAVPGVVAVGGNMQLPLSGSSWSGTDTFYDTTNGASGGVDAFEVEQRVVTPGYFRAAGTRLLAGRWFEERDDHQARPVVLVDETLARRVWPGEDPIGKKIARGQRPEEPFLFEVIGVVEHVRNHRLSENAVEQVYFAQPQLRFRDLSVIVRAQQDPMALVDPIRAIVRDMDPELPIYAVRPMDEYVSRAMAPARFEASLLSGFGLIGLLLAALGVFGVMSYAVRRRTRELGVRIAVGAAPGNILSLVVAEALRLAGPGIALGALGAVLVGRLLEGLVFGVTPTDPLTIAAGTLVLAAVALIAAGVPALRAIRIDPVEALRQE